MPSIEPIVWTFLLSASATAVLLLERRWRSRQNVLDTWAERQSLPCEKAPPLSVVSAMEPLAVVPPIVAIERMVTGVLSQGPVTVATRILVCVAGNRKKARRFVLGIFDSHPDLPAFRVLPNRPGDRDVPMDLGFTPLILQDSPGFSDQGAGKYTVESFGPLPDPVLRAVLSSLVEPAWRLEVRPGRLILATPAVTVGQVGAMLTLQLRLQEALHQALLSGGGEEPKKGPLLRVLPPRPGGFLN